MKKPYAINITYASYSNNFNTKRKKVDLNVFNDFVKENDNKFIINIFEENHVGGGGDLGFDLNLVWYAVEDLMLQIPKELIMYLSINFIIKFFQEIKNLIIQKNFSHSNQSPIWCRLEIKITKIHKIYFYFDINDLDYLINNSGWAKLKKIISGKNYIKTSTLNFLYIKKYKDWIELPEK